MNILDGMVASSAEHLSDSAGHNSRYILSGSLWGLVFENPANVALFGPFSPLGEF